MASYLESREITRAERETVFLYGVLVLLIGGGIGVYFPLILNKSIDAESLATYALASLAPLWTDIVLPERYWKEVSKRARMRIGASCGLAALFAFAALIRSGKPFDLTCATIGTFIVLGIFYHVSILSEKFKPDSPPKTEDGGANVSSEKLGGGGLQ
jgi:hypothetical protein